MRRVAVSAGALVLLAVAVTPARAAVPRTGSWYGDGPGWWLAFRVVRHGPQRVVTDVAASTDDQACTVEVGPDARSGSLGSLPVDARGRFGDRPRRRAAFFAHARFTRRGRAAGWLRWADPSGTCASSRPAALTPFRAAPVGPPRLATGRWSGVLAAQSAGGQELAAQPLGFDVLPGGRFLHTGTIRLTLLMHCSYAPDTWAPSTVTVSHPFGSVAGRRAIPPGASFVLTHEPPLGPQLRWRITADGKHARGEVLAGTSGPASGCSSLPVRWTAVGPG